MPRIEKLYAWVSTEPDGGEGVCAHEIVLDGRRMMAALVGADRARIESHRFLAQDIARAAHRPVHLVEFSERTDLGEA
jgi:hypothetical protein